jgi:hypothetical protein
VFEFAGDFLTCCGEGTTERGPWGEKAGSPWEAEKGVETGGVATAWEGACLDAIAVGVAILNWIVLVREYEWWIQTFRRERMKVRVFLQTWNG